MQHLHSQYSANYKSEYTHDPLGVSQLPGFFSKTSLNFLKELCIFKYQNFHFQCHSRKIELMTLLKLRKAKLFL